MSFHEILIAVMAAFAVAGAIDRIFGNRWGLGKEFEEGILAMGSLALAMVGIVCLAPVLASLLKPVIVPVFALSGRRPRHVRRNHSCLRHGRRRVGGGAGGKLIRRPCWAAC